MMWTFFYGCFVSEPVGVIAAHVRVLEVAQRRLVARASPVRSALAVLAGLADLDGLRVARLREVALGGVVSVVVERPRQIAAEWCSGTVGDTAPSVRWLPLRVSLKSGHPCPRPGRAAGGPDRCGLMCLPTRGTPRSMFSAGNPQPGAEVVDRFLSVEPGTVFPMEAAERALGGLTW